MESTPQLKVNSAYSSLDNSAVDTMMGYFNLPDSAWKDKLMCEPKKDNYPQVWAWKRAEKASKTEICIKIKCIFPGISMDKMLECFEPANATQWNDMPEFKVI